MALASALFVVTNRPPPFPFSNQNTYFPQGMRLGGSEFLREDWFANTQPAYWLFTRLVAGLQRLDRVESGSLVLDGTLQLVLLFSLALITARVAARMSDMRPTPALLSPVVALVTFGFALLVHPRQTSLLAKAQIWLGRELPLLRDLLLPNGVAGQSVYKGYFMPSELGVLAVLALALAAWNRYRTAAVFAGLATALHPSLAPATSTIVVVLCWLRLRAGRRLVALQAAAIFTAIAAPGILYLHWLTRDPSGGEAMRILAYSRVAHHALPWRWQPVDWARLATLGLTTVVLWRLRLRTLFWAFAGGMLVTAVGILLVTVTGSSRLALSHPWRITTLLYPAAMVILPALPLRRLERTPPGRSALRAVSVAAAVVAVGLLARALSLPEAQHFQPRPQRFAGLVREQAPPGLHILVPPSNEWEGFRLVAEHPTYVDRKNHPLAPRDVIEWRHRNGVARELYAAPAPERLRRCRDLGVDAYAIPRQLHRPIEPILLHGYRHILVSCAPSLTGD